MYQLKARYTFNIQKKKYVEKTDFFSIMKERTPTARSLGH